MENSSASEVQAGIIKAGAWGGKTGREWDMGPAARLLGLKIHSAAAVDALTVQYEDGNGRIKWSRKYGGQGGDPSDVYFEDGEYLTSISGYVAPFGSGNPVIASLTFGTNFVTYGPYGTEEGTPFSLPLVNGKIVGFFGRAGSLLNAIGVYLKPINA